MRRRQVMSAVAHYIAGVLDREAMVGIVDSVWFSATAFAVGDRVATPRGSLAGTVIALLPDGRIRWRADTGTELLSLPESLVREPARQQPCRRVRDCVAHPSRKDCAHDPQHRQN
jgi:hypothetical protein